jgi:hypothetical protein
MRLFLVKLRRAATLSSALLSALTGCLFLALPALASAPVAPPKVSAAIAGAQIEDVTIETYGQTSPIVVRRYLSLRKGSLLDQSGVNRDFANLRRLAGFIPRLVIRQGSSPKTATLHWIVMAKLLKPIDHPFYADQPLTAPIQGIGYIITSAPVDSRGSTFSSYSQLSRRANLVRILYTSPIAVNPVKGTETDVIVNTFGGRGVFRASQPLAINIYSWNTGAETALLHSATNGIQFEVGIRETRSTTAQSTGIVSPYVFQTSKSPAHNTVLEAGYSHACPVPSSQWYPPYCHTQYRLEAFDALGWFGSTSEYQSVLADVAQYVAIGKSTLVLHGGESRTGGVVPDSFLVCAYVRAYRRPRNSGSTTRCRRSSSSRSSPRPRRVGSVAERKRSHRRPFNGTPTLESALSSVITFVSISHTVPREAVSRSRFKDKHTSDQGTGGVSIRLRLGVTWAARTFRQTNGRRGP